MYHKQSIYDDMEFGNSELDAGLSNSQPKSNTSNKILTIKLICSSLIVIIAVGTYYLTKKKYREMLESQES